MELNWSTFVLEIVNFLVLVWILKRFLYRPVLDIIAERRARIEKAMADAETLRRDAKELEDRYKNRLADWEREKNEARVRLRAELDAERLRLLAKLQAALEEERQRARTLEERRLGEEARRSEEIALAQAARFAARLLSRIAGPEVDGRLAALALEELSALPAERQQQLRDALAGSEPSLRVASAYPLGKTQRTQLAQAFERLLGRPVTCEFVEDRTIQAGLRITVGAWVLQANLNDELKFFSEVMPDGS